MLLAHKRKMKINATGWLHFILIVTHLQYKFNEKAKVICINHTHLLPQLRTLLY
jgi:hypothetical protein